MAIPYEDSIQRTTAQPRWTDEVFADLTARNAFAVSLRYVGMSCFVIAEAKNFQLVGGTANANWAEFAGGGGGGGIQTVEDYTELFDFPDADRYLGMVIYIEASKEHVTLREGLDDLDWEPLQVPDEYPLPTPVGEANKLVSSDGGNFTFIDPPSPVLTPDSVQGLANGAVIDLPQSSFGVVTLTSDTDGLDAVVTIPNGVYPNQIVYFRGLSANRSVTIENSGNVIANGDVTLTPGVLRMAIWNPFNNKWEFLRG